MVPEAYSYHPQDAVQFTGQEAVVAQSLDSKIVYTNDLEAVTALMVDYLSDNPEELGQGRYTEIHLVNDAPVIIVSPRDMRPYGASVGGSHSIVDELRNYDGSVFPNFMAVVEQTSQRVSTDTIVGKGSVRKNADTGQMDLKVEELRSKDLQWIEQLRAVATGSGITGNVLLGDVYANRKDVCLDVAPVKISVRNELKYISELSTEEALIKQIELGIMTSVSIEPVKVKRGYPDDVIERAQHIEITTNMARRQMHGALYDNAGITNPMGLIPVQIDGEQVMMGLRYTDDKANKYRSINMFYDKQYGPNVTRVQQAIIAELCSSVLYGRSPLRITTAAGNQLLSDHTIQ